MSEFAKKKHEEIDDRFVSTKNIVLYNYTKIGVEYPMLEKHGGYYLYYGRLSHEKGVDTLLEVFSKHPELMLKVVGTGPREEKLKRTATENIRFLGYRSGGELAELVRSARFVCVPSEWYENNPMTIVEAYSMGVPVIGANIGGIPEIVEEGQTGFLFESGVAQSLEKALARSLSVGAKDYEAMKENALQFAKDHFDSGKYKDKLVSFYKEVIDEIR